MYLQIKIIFNNRKIVFTLSKHQPKKRIYITANFTDSIKMYLHNIYNNRKIVFTFFKDQLKSIFK